MSLSGAYLQWADLGGAQLQGANLSAAQLQGANLFAAQLQGANLWKANISLIGTNVNTDLSLADLRDVESNMLAPEARAELKTELEQAISDPKMRAGMLERLEPILNDQPPAWKPETLLKNQRRDVLTSEGAPEAVWVLTGGEALVSPRDDGTYGKALAAELAQRACSLGDGQITNSFVNRIGWVDLPVFPLQFRAYSDYDFYEYWRPRTPYLTARYLPDFVRHLTARCPDLIAEFDASEQQAPTDTSAKAAATEHP